MDGGRVLRQWARFAHEKACLPFFVARAVWYALGYYNNTVIRTRLFFVKYDRSHIHTQSNLRGLQSVMKGFTLLGWVIDRCFTSI